MGWLALLILLAAGIWAIFDPDALAYFGMADESLAGTLRGVAIAIAIAGTLALNLMSRAESLFRQISTGAVIALTALSVYGFRDEIVTAAQRIAGHETGSGTAVVADNPAPAGDPRTVAIRANEQGQFNVDAMIERTHVSMLADTGATLVTLSHEDAQRIGIDMNALEFSVPLNTANGLTHGAFVELDEVSVGGIQVRNVAAVVSQPGVLHFSLLGMSYFREIRTFEMSGDQLVLRN